MLHLSRLLFAFPITVLFAIREVPQLRVTPTPTSKSNSEKREHWGLWFEKHEPSVCSPRAVRCSRKAGWKDYVWVWSLSWSSMKWMGSKEDIGGLPCTWVYVEAYFEVYTCFFTQYMYVCVNICIYTCVCLCVWSTLFSSTYRLTILVEVSLPYITKHNTLFIFATIILEIF